MSSNAEQEVELLAELQQRRAQLRASMGALEEALAAAYSARAAAPWLSRLRSALAGLYDDFGEHVSLTEGREGLYGELARLSPRLARTVERQTTEHGEIGRRLEELLTLVDVGDLPDVRELRRAAMDLLVVMMRHRQRVADLVFEAYDLDLGGET